ncbi:hypothetical protein BGZ46_003102 [Entomortierella lignicola]|nr:hypothetical protein BGZ46_003102 [Entomortierella lignicola]
MSEAYLTNSLSRDIDTVTRFMSATISSTQIYSSKVCVIKNTSGCEVGFVRGMYYDGIIPSAASFKAELVNNTQSNLTFSGGVPEPDKYPWDVVTAIPKTPMDGSLCKRSTIPPIMYCAGPDTLISGQTLWGGQSLISPIGFQ